jgi:excinuclease ABC A subunit
VSDLTEEQLHILKYGDGGKTFKGYLPWIHDVCNGAFSSSGRLPYLLNKSGYLQTIVCPKCKGSSLGEQAAHTTISGNTITELEDMYITNLYDFLKKDKHSGTRLVKEILIKLECMIDVGLHHLALSRPVPTLSGGEIQRLFLASYIIAEMDSIIFIFDEPTIGLHEIEKQKLIDIIQNLIKRGNTVVAVEHDINFMQAADYIIDLGPYAGEYGGERIFQGSYDDFMKAKKSMTASYLSGKLSMPIKTVYKPINKSQILTLDNCNIHNLRDISVNIPLGLLVGVAGVSGSGKSSIISDTLVPKLKEILKSKIEDDDEIETIALPSVKITGTENLKKCIIIDQKPIGRSRTSCPAIYTGILDRVRRMFAETPESISQGFKPGMFSLNSEGKCRTCGGDGVIHFHVGYGNFIDVDCEVCGTTGFTPESMTITVDGKNIKNILEMSITNAIEYFKDKDKPSYCMLKTLDRVGLGYMSLWQKTPTISGGEAQRIKLAKELGKSGSSRDSMYILDEPTTGLSFSDSEKLIRLMQELVDSGNTVVVTEHDPIVLSNCDYIIEMGPGGGSDGGYIIAEGTPSQLKKSKKSMIGKYLK